MRTATEWLSEYGASHTNPTNKALHWLRDTMGSDPQDDATVHRRIMALLQDARQSKSVRDDLADGLSTLPAWMQAYLKPMLASRASAA